MSETTFLFANPSFLTGVARTLDMSGSFDDYNRSEDPDSLALANDWIAVGKDINSGITQYVGTKS